MKERSGQLLSEVGESLDYLRDEIRNLSLYITELEDLLEQYRTFVSSATLSTFADMARQAKLLKDAEDLFGPLSVVPSSQHPSKESDETDIAAMAEAFRRAARVRSTEK
jgi:hypothetical protein